MNWLKFHALIIDLQSLVEPYMLTFTMKPDQFEIKLEARTSLWAYKARNTAIDWKLINEAHYPENYIKSTVLCMKQELQEQVVGDLINS